MPQHWTPQQAWNWYDKKPWVVGCNFLPSTAINDVEMWQAETFDAATIDRELGWAAKLGFNSIRVFLQYIVWEADPAGFIQRFDGFLRTADSHGLTVTPILFDDCCFAGKMPRLGKQDDPIPGVHNSGWVPSPGWDIAKDKARRPMLERYVREMVGHFARDRRIMIWDLYNEPGAAGDRLDSTELLAATFQWARQAGPSQPLTTGLFHGKLDAPTIEEIAPAAPQSKVILENSDVLSFHNYCPLNIVVPCIRAFKKAGRPIFCTEWMARGTMESLFQTHLPVWKADKIGCYNWGLVAGKTQTYYPWGSPKGAAEPAVWHHDILRKDGSPFDPAEVEAIRRAVTEP